MLGIFIADLSSSLICATVFPFNGILLGIYRKQHDKNAIQLKK